MKEKKKSDVAVLLDYAGNRKGLTFLGLFFFAQYPCCSPWRLTSVSGLPRGI